jgi:hypothetical protein
MNQTRFRPSKAYKERPLSMYYLHNLVLNSLELREGV